MNAQIGQLVTVKPGDLITADLMNLIIAVLIDHEKRITTLEQAGTIISNAVVITGISPAGSLTVGQEIQVQGRNFAVPANLNFVTVDGIAIDVFNPGSNDSTLVFDLPATVQGVPKDATLTVRNQNGAASTTIHIVPSTLSGNIDMSLLNVDPQTITPGQPVTFQFQIATRTNQAATYSIKPIVSLSDWQNNLQVLDSGKNILQAAQLTLGTTDQQQFYVRINPVPANTTATNFALVVDASAGGVTGSTGQLSFPIGQPIQQQDTSIKISFNFANPSSAFDTASNTIHVAAGNSATIGLDVLLSQVGTVPQTYDVAVVFPSPTTGWTITPTFDTVMKFTQQPGDFPPGGGPVAKTPKFTVTPAAGATSPGKVEFHIKREGASNDAFTPFGLSLT